MEPDEVLAAVGTATDRRLGNYAYPCFPLARRMRRAPAQIAQQLEEAIAAVLQPADPFRSIAATGPYLNACLDAGKLGSTLIPSVLEGRFLAPREDQGARVMIEYSQPNTHKGFHVGHTRNVALGNLAG
ncbi:MAG: arginyl-tRNA synthetase [Myxococcota bacterium]|jgi:arginyl-tRNA synthetase